MAWTFVAAGTFDRGTGALAPGAPAGVQAGDLLLAASGSRNTAETITDPTGWTRLIDSTSSTYDACALWGRIADLGANDAWVGNWSAAAEGTAQIAAFRGAPASIVGIATATNSAGNSGNTADIPNPSLTVPADNQLIIGVGIKSKTVTSDAATMTSPTGLSNRIGFDWAAGSVTGLVWDYEIQTTASNISASVWNQSVDENRPYASVIASLAPLASSSIVPILMNHYRLRRGS